MKKWLPYIIGLAACVLLVVLIATGSKARKASRKMDERITLKQRDQIPYGTAAARSLLQGLFPYATVYTDAKSPGMWDEISNLGRNQAVILTSRAAFNADEYELERLLNFAEHGNYVLIISKGFSNEAVKTFGFTYSQNSFEDLFGEPGDSLAVKLEKPFFRSDEVFVYPGFKYESWFSYVDSAHTAVLGRNAAGQPDFLKFSRGSGAIFIHSAPLAFSNYFILHKNNIRYFQSVLSVIPRNVERILWNEYYLAKPTVGSSEKQEENWLRPLLRIPAFRWGFLTLLFLTVLYVLLNSRRRQRLIPVRARPRNESLDFIKTMGRLYHERKDHTDIAQKMGVYFLEHIRAVYKLPTHTLDENFIRALHFKSGYPEHELNDIVSFLNDVKTSPAVSEERLAHFHRQLELFYQNT